MGELLAKATILAARAFSEVLLFGLRAYDKGANVVEQADACCRREGEPKVGLSE